MRDHATLGTTFRLFLPKSEEASAVQEVGDVGSGAGAVEEDEELPHPTELGLVHAEPFDLILEPPAAAFENYLK